MTLYEAAKDYMVYTQAHHLPVRSKQVVRETLQHILWFYGRSKPLDSMDNATVLQYVKLFDPFDCDPIHEMRGEEYCKFIDWLIHNHLIPAWADQMEAMKDWAEADSDAYFPRGGYSAC